MHGSAGTYYYLLDRQGGPTTLIDTSGAKAGAYTYDPYGKTTVNSGTSTTAAQTNPWRYTGGYQDPGDNYYKLGARYYDTAGHFTQADPIAGSITRPEKNNSYTYTAGDPMNNTDLSGQAPNESACTGSYVVMGIGGLGILYSAVEIGSFVVAAGTGNEEALPGVPLAAAELADSQTMFAFGLVLHKYC